MFEAFIEEASRLYAVPDSWIKAVIDTESGWNPDAKNPADPSYGLMGLTLPAAQDMGYSGASSGLYDPETNIHFGTAYIRWIMDRWNTSDFREVYSAYNSGSPTLWQQSRTGGAECRAGAGESFQVCGSRINNGAGGIAGVVSVEESMSAYRLYIKTLLPDGVVVYDTGATLPGCSPTNTAACDAVEFGTLQEVLDYAASRGEVPRECASVEEVWQIVASGEQPPESGSLLGLDSSSLLMLGGGLLVLLMLSRRRRG